MFIIYIKYTALTMQIRGSFRKFLEKDRKQLNYFKRYALLYLPLASLHFSIPSILFGVPQKRGFCRAQPPHLSRRFSSGFLCVISPCVLQSYQSTRMLHAGLALSLLADARKSTLIYSRPRLNLANQLIVARSDASFPNARCINKCFCFTERENLKLK